jgi:hypothetical protein
MAPFEIAEDDEDRVVLRDHIFVPKGGKWLLVSPIQDHPSGRLAAD